MSVVKSRVAMLVIFFLYSSGLHAAADPATLHFIRAGASGNNDGSDWTNAWTLFASVLWTRGHTYYVATDVYNGNVTVQKAENGTEWISIKKAILADHGTDTGWQTSYGTGPAEILGKLYIANAYIEVDGQVGSDNSGHGFRVTNPVVGGNVLQIETNRDHVHLSHIEIKGSGSPGTNPYGTSVENGLYINGLVPRSDIKVAHCWIHHVNRDGVVVAGFNGSPGLLFEHNRVERTGGHADPAAHGQGMDFAVYSVNSGVTLRYNKFVDIVGSANIAFLGGSTNSDVKIYGNIFWSSDQSQYSSSPGVIWTRGLTPETTMNGLYVYNNVFHNITLAQIANDAVIRSNGFVRNNIWEDSAFTGYPVSITHRGVVADHNYYYNNTHNNAGAPPIGATDVQGTSSAFVDAALHDYRLTSSSLAQDKGASLSSPYNHDGNGTYRPQDAGWDIGAYEYCEGGCETNPGDGSTNSGPTSDPKFGKFKNVFNPSRGEKLIIKYTLSKPEALRIVNSRGEKVFEKNLEPTTDYQEIPWDGKVKNQSVASGVYLLILGNETTRAVVVK